LGLVILASRTIYRKEEARKDALRRIRERGYLLVLTDRNTLNYFVYKGVPMGYQHDLAQSFGKFLGVPVKMIASDNIHQLRHFMDHNIGDILALDLPITKEGKEVARFSDPVRETRLVLVRRKPGKALAEKEKPVTVAEQFPSDTVDVPDDPFLEPLFRAFVKTTGKRAILRADSALSQEQLIIRVAKGEIRYALCRENVAMVLHRNYPMLDISVLAFPLFSCTWGINRHSDSLRTMVNQWLKEERKSGDLKYTYLSYFQNDRINGFFRSDFFSVTGKKLSPFDDAIRANSKIIHWDWRLIASLIYQESNFQSGLTSARSAHGLMQLMPATAAKFGVDSVSTPARQIAGGIRYLNYIDKQLPEEITDPIERVFFILATYNVGIGRVMAAREKAEKYGRDKNRWNRHTDYYLLRKSKKDPEGVKDTTELYPVDLKNEGFVDEVVGRYFHYRNLIR
jgi:membrane-bound lytic murein transglycosylase F